MCSALSLSQLHVTMALLATKRGRPQWAKGCPIREDAYLRKSRSFFAKHACMKASASETMWSGVLKPRVWMSGTSLVGALNHKNTELFNRPGEGTKELAHSIDALPCATSTTWTPLFEGVIDVTPLLADVQHVIALANNIKMTWERASRLTLDKME